MNWRAMVRFTASGWANNAPVFATREEALASARDMFDHKGVYSQVFPDEVYEAYDARETHEPVNYELDLRTGVCAPLPTMGVVA